MTLPDITAYIPKIEVPFQIDTLWHPIVVHFMIVLPVVVLMLELTNIITKKKNVGVVSFVLLLITVVAAVGAYLTGLVDGKEGFDVLSEAGKEELAEHKLLGTYLMLGSMVALLFKLLSASIHSAVMKLLYLLTLIALVYGIYVQGEDGGELVFEYGMNVEKIKALDDKIFDLEEALEEAKEKLAQSMKKTEESVVAQEVPEVIKAKTPEETTPIETIGTTQEQSAEVKALPYVEPVQVERIQDVVPQVKIPTH